MFHDVPGGLSLDIVTSNGRTVTSQPVPKRLEREGDLHGLLRPLCRMTIIT